MSFALAIETARLTKDFKSQFWRKQHRVIDSVSLSVTAGETYGLIGSNGAGKTTLFKLLLGLLKPTSGESKVLGQPAGSKAILAKIGFLSESTFLYSHLTGREYLDFIGRLVKLESKARKDKVKQLLELFEMTEYADLALEKYSKGMLQRIAIAQSLINDPKLLLWDEPMSGLDLVSRKKTQGILQKLKSEGCTIFLSSHQATDLSEICDKIGILQKGRLIVQTAMNEISAKSDPKELERYFYELTQSRNIERGNQDQPKAS